MEKTWDREYAKQLRRDMKYDELFAYCKEFADMQVADAVAELAICYNNCEGTFRDVNKSLELLNRSVAMGSIEGMVSLGRLYEIGNGEVQDDVKAVELYRKAAELGNMRAMYYLGKAYENGTGVEEDEVAAIEWIRKSAEQGYAYAQFDLGVCYEYGTGVEKDEAKAVELYRKAAEQGNLNALYFLGKAYEGGHGVEQDQLKAFELYKKAAEQGHQDSKDQMHLFYEVGIYHEGLTIKRCQIAAEQGNELAQYLLGDIYWSGTGVEKDEPKAVECYTKAAELGHPGAQYKLGLFSLDGAGIIIKDEVAAVQWFEKSAAQEYKKAQYMLGVCYANGIGVKKDEIAATKWYEEAAGGWHGNTYARHNLGVSYLYGIGVEKDEVKAVMWFQMAADRKLKEAQHALGMCYENGTGVKKDVEKAIEWYSKSAKQGFVSAKSCLVRCYWNGIDITKYETSAVEWCRQAAEYGHPIAQVNLGECYELGTGVERNNVKAFEWYERAAEQNDAVAKYRLALFYYNGMGIQKNKVKAIEYFKQAAELGHADAQNHLALCLMNSRSKSNHKKAYDLLKTNSDAHSESCNILALCYMLGKGTNKNPAHAVELWKKASKMGSNWAQYNLARAYEYGDGIEKNVVAALALYNKASKKGIADSSLRAKKLVKKIIRELTRYSQKNNAEAQYNLGLFYLNDEYGVKDIDKAITFLNESAKNNYALAQCRLAIIYSEGKQVPTEYNKAFAFLLKAAKNDLHIAQLLLSKVYECGMWDQLENEEEAKYWYSKYENVGIDDSEDASLEGHISWKFKFRDISGIIIDTLTSKSRIKQLEANIAELKRHNDTLEREKVYLESENIGLKKDKQFLQNEVKLSLNKIEDDVNAVGKDVTNLTEEFKKFSSFFETNIAPALLDFRNDVKGFKDKIPELFDKYYAQLEKSNEESELIRKQLDKLDEGFAAITKRLNDHFSADTESMQKAEKKLQAVFDDTWNRLLPDSRTSLCSAHLMWERCKKETKFDWSGVCILATSALEREVKRVFSDRFEDYLNGTGQTDLNQWPRCLCYKDKNDNLQPSTRFMLGNFQYMIGAKKDKNPDPNLSEKRKAYLNAIIAEEHLKGIEDATVLFTNKKYGGKTFAQRCDYIANNYRNKAAHDDTIDKETAGACYDALIPGERAKQTLNNINNLLIILYRLIDDDKMKKYLPNVDE